MKRLLKSGSVLFLEEFTFRLTAFLSAMILSRGLSPEEFGLLLTGGALLGNLELFADFGLRTTGLIETAHPKETRSVEPSDIFAIRLISHLVLFTLAEIVIFFLPLEPRLKQILMIYGGALIFEGLYVEWFFRGKKKFIPSAIARAGAGIAYTFAAFFIVNRSNSAVPIAISYVIINIIVATLLLIKSPLRFIVPAKEKALQTIYKILPVGGGRLFQQLPLFLPPLIITSLVSLEGTAHFGTAYRVITISLIVDRIVLTLFLSELPKKWHENPKLTELNVQKLFRGLLLFCTTVIVIYSFLGGTLLSLIFGEQYRIAAPLLKPLGLFMMFTILNSIVSYSIIAIDDNKQFFRAAFISVVLTLPFLPILTKQFGVMGAASAMALAEGAIYTLSAIRLNKKLSLPHIETILITLSLILLFSAPTSMMPVSILLFTVVVGKIFFSLLKKEPVSVSIGNK